MAKHIHRTLTPAQLKRSREARAAFEAEKDEIVAKGRDIFERHERLMLTLRSLRAERQRQGISLAEMQRRTGITKSALSRLENDETPNPTINTLERIADALGKVLDVVVRDAKTAA